MEAADAFCGRCGSRQPVQLPASPPGSRPPPRTGLRMNPSPIAADPLAGINPRTASILCYVPAVGWIASIVVLASQRFRRDRLVRFHAFQGLYLFVAWLMEDWVLRPMAFCMIPHLHIHQLVEAVLLGMSIFMMVKASHDEAYSLPSIRRAGATLGSGKLKVQGQPDRAPFPPLKAHQPGIAKVRVAHAKYFTNNTSLCTSLYTSSSTMVRAIRMPKPPGRMPFS